MSRPKAAASASPRSATDAPLRLVTPAREDVRPPSDWAHVGDVAASIFDELIERARQRGGDLPDAA
ncbi:MAG TPA: hypothetical protein VEQ42_06880, partial [Pyrinomonadaceae bacterium]|nr:hypothetical protein [Pyrinomonadaceae bacterium]